MDKATVLSELQLHRRHLEKALEEVGEARMAQPGVQDGWTVKDIIVHIAAWDRRGANWIRQVARGESPQIPEPSLTWEDIDRLNERELTEDQSRPLAEALSEFGEAYGGLLEVIEGLSDEDLAKSAPYSYPRSERVRVGQLIRWRYGRYTEHRNAIRSWLDSLESDQSEVVIRPMKAGDAGPVADLCTQLGYPSSADQVARRFDQIEGSSEHDLFVAELPDGRLAGWLHMHDTRLLESDPMAEVWGLVVDAEHRGLGIGRLLMEGAERWALAHGYDRVRLRSNVARKQAHEFYKRIGYDIIKRSYTFQKQLSQAEVDHEPSTKRGL